MDKHFEKKLKDLREISAALKEGATVERLSRCRTAVEELWAFGPSVDTDTKVKETVDELIYKIFGFLEKLVPVEDFDNHGPILNARKDAEKKFRDALIDKVQKIVKDSIGGNGEVHEHGVDGLGNPIDGQEPIASAKRSSVEVKAPGIAPPVLAGVKAVDVPSISGSPKIGKLGFSVEAILENKCTTEAETVSSVAFQVYSALLIMQSFY